MAVLPKNAPGSATVSFDDQIANVLEKPGEITRVGDMALRGCAKPTNAADLGFLGWPVSHMFWFAQMFVKPIQQATDFLHLPQVMKVGLVIPNVKCSAEDALVAPRIRIRDGRFKSDIHGEYLRETQTFLRKFRTEFRRADCVVQFRSVFSQWCVRRKTYQTRGSILVWKIGISKRYLDQLSYLKRFVLRMETTS
jgi:hypothetical protein